MTNSFRVPKDQERRWAIEKKAVELLTVIAAEFKSDPSSVACFDLRVVQEAIAITDEYPKLKGAFL